MDGLNGRFGNVGHPVAFLFAYYNHLELSKYLGEVTYINYSYDRKFIVSKMMIYWWFEDM